MEQRLLGHRVEFAVELQVLFRSDVGRFLRPQRFDVVNDVVFVRVDIFAVFPLLDLAEGNGNGQETAMLFQNLADAGRVVEFEAVFREDVYKRQVLLCIVCRRLPVLRFLIWGIRTEDSEHVPRNGREWLLYRVPPDVKRLSCFAAFVSDNAVPYI